MVGLLCLSVAMQIVKIDIGGINRFVIPCLVHPISSSAFKQSILRKETKEVRFVGSLGSDATFKLTKIRR